MSATRSFPDHAAIRDGVALSFAPGIGCTAFRRLVERYGSAAAALVSVPEPDRGAARRRADAVLSRAQRADARLILLGEPEYPDPLLDLPDAPSTLWALGDPAVLSAPMVSIVGTRLASPGGERFAHRLAGEMVRRGAVIVSGMARGIDAAAHRGALDAGGRTIAVLGGGVDVPYPPSHRALHREIARRGLVLSETEPGGYPGRGAFPRRNRIIAALGSVVIVVEAGAKSGALITSKAALGIGRWVGAVPGAVDSPRSAGTNDLLRDGAIVIASVEDALVLAGLTSRPAPERPSHRRKQDRPAEQMAATHGDELPLVADPASQAVLSALHTGAANLDDLQRLTSLPVRALLSAIGALEVAGVLWTDHTGGIRLAP